MPAVERRSLPHGHTHRVRSLCRPGGHRRCMPAVSPCRSTVFRFRLERRSDQRSSRPRLLGARPASPSKPMRPIQPQSNVRCICVPASACEFAEDWACAPVIADKPSTPARTSARVMFRSTCMMIFSLGSRRVPGRPGWSNGVFAQRQARPPVRRRLARYARAQTLSACRQALAPKTGVTDAAGFGHGSSFEWRNRLYQEDRCMNGVAP